MGSNMQKQATPCLIPEAPLVATGIEEKAALDSGRILLAEEEGTVSHIDATKIVIKNTKGKEIVTIVAFNAAAKNAIDNGTLINQGVCVKK